MRTRRSQRLRLIAAMLLLAAAWVPALAAQAAGERVVVHLKSGAKIAARLVADVGGRIR